MSDAENAVQAVLGLVLGGLLFVTFGSALAQTETAANWPLPLDFRLWGAIYIVAAVVLAVVLVVGAVYAFLEN